MTCTYCSVLHNVKIFHNIYVYCSVSLKVEYHTRICTIQPACVAGCYIKCNVICSAVPQQVLTVTKLLYKCNVIRSAIPQQVLSVTRLLYKCNVIHSAIPQQVLSVTRLLYKM